MASGQVQTQDLRRATGFSSIPVETLLHISSYLTQSETSHLAQACRGSYNVLNTILYQHDARQDDQHALWFACAHGKMAPLKRILDLKIHDINRHFKSHHHMRRQGTMRCHKFTKNYTPLMVAITSGNYRIVRELLREGASPHTPSLPPIDNHIGRCYYPINMVMLTKSLPRWSQIVTMLVEANVDINQAPANGPPNRFKVGGAAPIFDLLHLDGPFPSREQQTRPTTGDEFNDDFKAALRQRMDRLKLLLELGASTSVRGLSTHHTPLFSVMYKLLLWTPTFYFPISMARQEEKDAQRSIVTMAAVSILRVLKRHGADVNTQCELTRGLETLSPLHIACKLYSSDKIYKPILEWLIRNGADIQATNSFGSTPLILFCRKLPLNTSIIEDFIKMGVDVNHQNMNNVAALHQVWSRYRIWTPQQEDVVMMLLRWGANLSLQDNNGRTPLSKYMQNPPDNILVLEEFMARGASPKVRDKKGCTPLHELCLQRYISFDLRKKIIHILLRHGAEVYDRNYDGCTAIDCALRIENKQLAEFLEEVAEKKPEWEGQQGPITQGRQQGLSDVQWNAESN